MKKYLLILLFALVFTSCNKPIETSSENKSEAKIITDNTINDVVASLLKTNGEENKFRIEKGVAQTASLWREIDGNSEDFAKFCNENFITDKVELDESAKALARHYEVLYGHFNLMGLKLKEPMQLEIGELTKLDRMFGALDPSAHITSDMYVSKIAFNITLNFPFYKLSEKMELGKNWTRKEWEFARIGDMFTSRVPAEILAKDAEIQTNGDQYIAEYNIMMGELVDDDMKAYFPKDMALITHWNLRDEIKSQYANKETGLEHQKMIYKVMTRIIDQSIPSEVISKADYQWNPYSNKIYKDGKEVNSTPEPDNRYMWLLANFHSQQAIDEYTPNYPSYIQRRFERNMEIPVERIETMFKKLLKSEASQKVADLIKKRLGRDLMPYDIWYNGFKGEIDGAKLDIITKNRWANASDFNKSLPEFLLKLGWNKERAEYLSSKIDVDPARGAGHAAGAQMKGNNAHLRTRIGKSGMDYKGYNIAIHEFGHNTEQTVSLYDIDYWFLRGVPNTAFTEAAAFLFQARDLDLLGVAEKNEESQNLATIDIFWSSFEIMGVSLVDIAVWKWMYANPKATPAELKAAVMQTAKDVWNEYYSPIFATKDETILAIYSHMIAYPLYLSAYPVGHLAEFQLEQQIKGKVFADEFDRIYKGGSITPDNWMVRATGNPLSVEPTIDATLEAVGK